MRYIRIAAGCFGLATALSMAAATAALAEMKTMKVDLKASEEVPPADSQATGSAEVTFDTDTKKLSWTVTHQNLTGEPTAAHFHGPAGPGENAGPAVDISGDIASGSVELTDAQIADLEAGKWYINVHTAKFPDGEIRGQVTAQ